MSNDLGNIDILEHGRAYRFGELNCPRRAQRRASRPWSVRKAVKHLMAATFNLSDPAGRKLINTVLGEASKPVTLELLLKALKRDAGLVSVPELLAMHLLLEALNGNVSAMARLTYIVDGPPLTEDEIDRENRE